ncbi:HAMP domain-containing protein [Mycolicibacterium wolinskyi]|uniref:histidine kinase n=1 Tax=Mycolicibacterium wolinskyi TaxID=59750 RepID=A0A1X2FBV5_9MYCO|nr:MULTISPECIES: ATP-binding protein [Mycolicibacterium]MCV7283799.1 HAMP domain-containing protein [Mycolicibacterium wolinskyi]MCV7297233.1 HAMP domain-containing protein [Mycolicibacterium goodii]ORX15916.1 histidine kinase [Mycolicibacterium wolinskyi]
MTHPTAQRFWRTPGIGMRLLIAQTAVLLAGAITTWLVAAVVGPPLFREHLHRAGVPSDSAEELHAEEAYQYATMLSLGGAVIVAAATAILVTWYVSRRLQRSVAEVASAASGVADGRYGTRVPPPRLGADFDSLAHAFNHMAAQLQAVDANRRQLFSDLAHEIRTPVSVLDAYIEAVEDGVRSLTPDTTAMLRDQTRRLVRFAEDVAALAQAEEGTASMSMAELDITEVMLGAATAFTDRFQAKQVSLETDLPSPLPPAYGDRQRLAQVLTNLLDNALRHTPPHGTVSVNARTRGDRILLQVTDTGEGISAQHLPHVFDRLYRADPARTRDHGGSGLGLSIVKAIVEAHGGIISVESPSSTGHTTFTITLPVSAAQRGRPPIN